MIKNFPAYVDVVTNNIMLRPCLVYNSTARRFGFETKELEADQRNSFRTQSI
jgi:hypothetical protein